ncbi:unnamed protein product [Calypogeia fissa]
MVVHQAWETIEHIENYGRHEGDQPGYSAQQVPHRPLPPFISKQVWYDAFLNGALDMLASSAAPPPPPPPPSPSREEAAINLITLGLPLEGGQLEHDVPTRVLRTGPRSERRRRHYEHLVVPESDSGQPPVGVDCIQVCGRNGMSYVHGKARDVFKDFSSSIFKFPLHIPYDAPVEVWGRSWLVKASSLGVDIGYGLFALEDIEVPSKPWRGGYDGESLFPYIGAVYSSKNWNILVRQHPSWAVYALRMNSDSDELLMRPWHCRMVDGDPVRSSNLAGYINSTQGRGRVLEPNVEWVQVFGPPHPPYFVQHMDDHIMTVAIRTIRAGEELLCDYGWDAPKKVVRT